MCKGTLFAVLENAKFPLRQRFFFVRVRGLILIEYIISISLSRTFKVIQRVLGKEKVEENQKKIIYMAKHID